MKDNFKIRGTFAMKVIKNGEVIEEFTEPNLIVNAGFGIIAQRLSAEAADKELSQIQVGGLSSGDPVPPEAGWTAIPSPILAKDVDSVTYPTSRSISFNWQLLGTEGNGNNIAYFALKATDGTLFAAKSRPAIVKTADIVLEGTWIIHF